METERNKKRPYSGSDDEGKTSRPRMDEGGDRTVTEEEVDEFYAILRRIHETSRTFAVSKGNGGAVGGGRRRGRRAASWVPAFKLEDFEEVGAVKVNGTETPANEEEMSGGEGRRRLAVVKDGIPVCLDLNTEPVHKGPGHVKPEADRGCIG
ncbi:protein NIM1-INTERACTING 2 [Cocos nucifera]|uniref:Protein NIM1-INTERACTING 2 n=1 Tax=Cocos nucifera TaxID=13894 RepID=A0A8K0IC67_COCNU|nr:protein NIM1-INTERACTING 2 [Cocos nucifera]